jgi:hypothetical protein
LTRPNGTSSSRRVLLIISPSLRVGPASLARGFRRTRQEAALLTPSPLRSSSSVPPPTPPRLGTPGRPVVGPGTPLPASSLAVATPAGISTPLHHRCRGSRLTHVIWWRVPPLVHLNLSGSSITSAYSVSLASRTERRVLCSAATATVSASSPHQQPARARQVRHTKNFPT